MRRVLTLEEYNKIYKIIDEGIENKLPTYDVVDDILQVLGIDFYSSKEISSLESSLNISEKRSV